MHVPLMAILGKMNIKRIFQAKIVYKNRTEVFSMRNILNEESYGKDKRTNPQKNTGINYVYERISPAVPVPHYLVWEA